MPRYRSTSWRAFDPGALAGGARVAPAKAAPVIRLSAVANPRILGLDPGSRRTGYGVIECGDTNSVPVAHGCIAATNGTFSERLRQIFEGVQALIERYQPNEVAVERVFLNRNVESALKLGHARGGSIPRSSVYRDRLP